MLLSDVELRDAWSATEGGGETLKAREREMVGRDREGSDDLG